MPAGTLARSSSSSVAATPSCLDSTPEKPATVSEHRKSSKPIMEKRRRARINESLGQLKTLILDALKKDGSRHAKLEKADILEMTVRHLKNLQRLQISGVVNTDPSVLGKYRAGFTECLSEVTGFLSTCEGVNTEVRTRLLGHLAGCVTQINTVNYTASRQVPIYPPHAGVGQAMVQIPGGAQLPILNGMPGKTGTSIANEALKMYNGLQIVPTPDGQFAFLIPSAALAPLHEQQGHSALVLAMSPVLPPATSDSVWRPW
ncbi:transcription factor HES-1-A-like [Aplochiton taeniatus]